MLGTLGLLWATAFLVREARLAISTTFEEMEYARSLLRPPSGVETRRN